MKLKGSKRETKGTKLNSVKETIGTLEEPRGELKVSKRKISLDQKKLKFTRFLHRRRIFQEIQGFCAFLCGNILHFEAK